jgi:SAM-dependent methyltransferase
MKRMSGSFPIFDAVCEHLIAAIAPATALDIGAGAGKYGRLLAAAAPACQRTALEIEPAHVERFALRELYPRVEVANAAQWWRHHVEEAFDLVIAGDCLQQLPKSEGLDLVNAMLYRSAYLLLVAPEFVIQGAVEGLASAVHRSVWSERDLQWHDLWAWDHTRSVTLMLLRGYRPAATTLEALVRGCNDAHVPVRDYDGTTLVRPCRLRLVDHAREAVYRPR